MYNLKKVTLGIFVLLPLSCLLIFQSTSHSEPETEPVTYRYTFAPLGDGVYYEKYIPGEDAPISLYFTFDLAPPQLIGEINADIIFDQDNQENKPFRVKPRRVTDKDNHTFVGKLESEGRVDIGAKLILDFTLPHILTENVLGLGDIQINHEVDLKEAFDNLETAFAKVQELKEIKNKLRNAENNDKEKEEDLSGFNFQLPGVTFSVNASLEDLEKGLNKEVYFNSFLLEAKEKKPVLDIGIPELFVIAIDAIEIAQHFIPGKAIIKAGDTLTPAKVDTVTNILLDTLQGGIELYGGFKTPLTLSGVGFYLDNSFVANEGESVKACGLDPNLGFYGLSANGEFYSVPTSYVGNLTAEFLLTLGADAFFKFAPLGIPLVSYEQDIAEKDLHIAEKEFILNFEPTDLVKFEVDADSIMEKHPRTEAERFTQEFQRSLQWHLPEGAKMRLGLSASAIAYSPDGCQLAVAGGDGSISLYSGTLDPNEKREFYTRAFRTTGGIDILSFSPDGKILASGTGTTVRLWDVATGTLKATMVHERPWAAFSRSYGITGLSFSPPDTDGKSKTLASTYKQFNTRLDIGEVALWDVETGTLKGVLGHGVTGASFSPDGKILASGTGSGVRLWDVETQEEIVTLQPDVDTIYHVDFSPIGKTLASVGSDGGVHLWDVETQKEIIRFGEPVEPGSNRARDYDYWPYDRVRFSWDGKTLASSRWGQVVLWDVATEKIKIKETIHTGSELARSLSFNPAGGTLAGIVVNDWTAHVWQVHTGAEIATLTGRNGRVQGVSFSPDGETLASRHTDPNSVRLWDVTTGTLKNTTLPTGSVHDGGVSFSPDGETLATAGDGKVSLWDATTGKLKTTLLPTADTLEKHHVYSVSFSPDGKTLAGAGTTLYNNERRGGTVWLWNTTTWEEEITLPHDGTEWVYSVSFSPPDADGKTTTLASSDYEGIVRLWDVATGALKTTLEHTGYVALPRTQKDFRSVRFSPDGKILASGTSGGVLLWDVETQTEIAKLSTRDYEIYSVSFSPDSKILASHRSDGQGGGVLLWNVETQTEIARLSTRNDEIYSVSFSPDDTRPMLASAGDSGTVLLWDLTRIFKGTEIDTHTLTGHRRGVDSVSFSPDPDSKILASSGGGTARLWDVDTREEIATLNGPGYTDGVSFSQDGKILANGGGVLLLWDVENPAAPKEIATLRGHTGDTEDVSFSPDGKILASGGADGTVRLWDVENQTEIGTLTGHTDTVYSVSFSPDRDDTMPMLLASGGNDGTVRVWNVETHEEIATLRGHIGSRGYTLDYGDNVRITSVHFSPDGKTIASGGYDGTVRLWDVATKTLKTTLPHLAPGRPVSVSFSPDGKTIASGDGADRVILWDTTTGAVKATLVRDGGVNNISVSFSPDGKTIASGWHDGSLQLWDVASAVGVAREDFTVDVNGDGKVNIQDLVAVSAALGETGENDTDVNGDGKVNIQDLVAVSAALGQVAAAPAAIYYQVPGELTQADVQQWLIQAQQLDLTDPTTQRGILFLQYLLAVLTPKETVLLQNYPNPFNPETWIPYQLAKPAAVTLTIYAIDGKLVRTLDLGHQPIGNYHGKNRAAYWDGRNAVGEPVASGVYFYTLTASDFTATRKMLILK